MTAHMAWGMHNWHMRRIPLLGLGLRSGLERSTIPLLVALFCVLPLHTTLSMPIRL